MKIEVKWAIYFALMTLAWMYLEKLSGLHDKFLDYQMYLTNLFAVPAIWFMVMALRDKKYHYYNGKITYKQGWISGAMVSVFIALLSPITQWLISYVISPEYFPNVIKRSVEIGYFPSEEAARAQFNYNSFAISSTLIALVFGIITTTVAMLFIRSDRDKN